MPDFIRIYREMAEELINMVTNIWLICSRSDALVPQGKANVEKVIGENGTQYWLLPAERQ